ncbi:MAG TPA: copper resistance system multicopper oxidase [Parvularculaceae bacterium]|nr:copper resistance system multicopper oxidase [Parvularculaceae bacterium]HRX39777.1 copper resistance system multicopper oxidase [Parvularculaceae bacterium]
MLDRRTLMKAAGGGGFLAAAGLLPAWARSANDGNIGLSQLGGNNFDLVIGRTPVRIAGKAGTAVTINGTVPAPLLRWKEGETVTLNVTNRLAEDTSIHWHGVLVPNPMDGVPGIAFPGIKPGETFTYRFEVPQAGTYWYHSHSGLQEQLGHYGPLILDPAGADPISADREYVLVLSDWSFTDPHRIFAKLKKQSDSFNFQERTVGDFIKDAGEMGLGAAFKERAMWGAMRMSPADIADVTGSTYHYLINGHAPGDNWTAVFKQGERIRLRIINASAMSILNFRIPGLPMTVVQADGLNIKPVETDEFQIGVAETYDVIVTPTRERAYAIVAESIDRSGQGVATLAPRPGMRAEAPLLRERPTLTMKDMGMNHGAMGGMAMDSGSSASGQMDHGDHQMHGMDHGSSDKMSEMPAHQVHDMGGDMQQHSHKRGVGVDSAAMAPTNRLDEPGLGLEDVPHRTLRYSQLRSLDPNPDTRAPEREIEIHLTGNMERFMWSFDGVKFSEVVDPIVFYENERVRLTMVNDTMMTHPIHLHGMFFDIVNGAKTDKPRKHTINVKPGEKLSVDITADALGDWAFHCHLLYHMHAGMMQVVSVRPQKMAEAAQ